MLKHAGVKLKKVATNEDKNCGNLMEKKKNPEKKKSCLFFSIKCFFMNCKNSFFFSKGEVAIVAVAPSL